MQKLKLALSIAAAVIGLAVGGSFIYAQDPQPTCQPWPSCDNAPPPNQGGGGGGGN